MEAIYYIWGSEDYLIDRKVEELIARSQEETRGETEIIYLDTEEMRPQEWAQEMEFSPLFQLSRMIIMKRPPWLGAGNKRVKDEKLIRDIIESYVQEPPKGQILVLTASHKAASHPMVKLLDKKAEFIECAKLNPKQTELWIQEQAEKRKCHFASADIVRKLANSGQDLYYLSQLIQKLALLAPDGIIKSNMMDNQVEYKQEIKIFKLIDGVLDRRLPAALEALHQLLKQGEAEIYILYMLNRQFILFSQVKALHEEGKIPSEIEKLLKQKTFTVKKMLERVRKYRWDEIENGMKQLLKAEIDLKSTAKNPQILLEMLIISLIDGSEIPVHL